MLSVSVRHPIYLYELSDESVFTDVMTVRFYVRFAVSPTTVIHYTLRMERSEERLNCNDLNHVASVFSAFILPSAPNMYI